MHIMYVRTLTPVPPPLLINNICLWTLTSPCNVQKVPQDPDIPPVMFSMYLRTLTSPCIVQRVPQGPDVPPVIYNMYLSTLTSPQ